MNKIKFLSIIPIALLYLNILTTYAHEDAHEHASTTKIRAEIAQEAGIKLAVVESGNIERHVQVYGRLITPPTHQAHVRARFPGLVKQLKATTGDRVKKGDVLAVIESNESLRLYEVKAPITGVVQDRLINEGEITTDAPLFSLLNQDELWAELTIFPSQRAEITQHLPVHIRHNGHDHQGSILSITPAASPQGVTLPYVVARVPLNNHQGDMAAGDKVLADIDAETIQASKRVAISALQEIDGKQVVFVHRNATYEAVPVVIGVQDDHYTEIVHGLHLGDEYVTENSYLLKADLGKADAEHEH